jgi:hypothetical protein
MTMTPISLKRPKTPKLELALQNYESDTRTDLTNARMKLMSASILFARDPMRETRQQWVKRVGKAFGMTHLQADQFLHSGMNRRDL